MKRELIIRRSFTFIAVLGIVCALAVNALAQDVELSRGHQILLDRGLQIQAWVTPPVGGTDSFTPSTFLQGNFTTLNTQFWYNNFWPGQWGQLVMEHEVISGELIRPDELAYVDNLVTMCYRDEVDLTNQWLLDQIKDFTSQVRANYPHVIAHTNESGGQISYSAMRNYMEYCQPDMVMFDTYPFNGNLPGGSPTGLYRDMVKYRSLGLGGIDGTGNSLANVIIGNSGDNNIGGLAGDDTWVVQIATDSQPERRLLVHPLDVRHAVAEY